VGGALFAVAFLIVGAVLVGRAVSRRVRAAQRDRAIIVLSLDDVPGHLRRRACVCGRAPDVLGELATSQGLTVTRECVCGRRERVVFVLAH